jgi:alpha-galactosidase
MSNIMTKTERQLFHEWARGVFLSQEFPTRPCPAGLHIRRHDYHQLRMNRSSRLNTPLRIGAKKYEHGLGTHANSELFINAGTPIVKFEAEVGIDNNSETCGKNGTVVFLVEAGGKTLFDSGVRRGSHPPLPLELDMERAEAFTLKVHDAGDGVSYDHADWANARLTLADGTRIWLDELPVTSAGAQFSPALPFSFLLDGMDSRSFLSSWQIERRDLGLVVGKESHLIRYADPVTGMSVECELCLLRDYPAVEWVLRFQNGLTRDSALIEQILPLDLALDLPGNRDIVLHSAYGSNYSHSAPTMDFRPEAQVLNPRQECCMGAIAGRPSSSRLPFFNVRWPFGGLIGGIGWSGQWMFSAQRDHSHRLSLKAGQEEIRLRLRPGESFRTTRILLVSGEGLDHAQSQNAWRKVVLAHYTPKVDGVPAEPPIAQNTWFFCNQGNDVTEANQLAAIERLASLGGEAFWLDAGWFEGGWPRVGTWEPNKTAFPRGLRPLADAAHRNGMKFVLWFEPERVHPQSRIDREHPQWLLRPPGGSGDSLFNLGDTEAREWMTDLLSQCISDWRVDVLRIDFNIDPLTFWRANDTEDRHGMTEIRYIEGLYAMWDDLRSRHPALIIDNCASGGRRIDLETITRAIPLWRSDSQCCGMPWPEQDQAQTAGLSLFVPLHTAGAWDFDPYIFRSVATAGVSLCMDLAEYSEADVEKARRALDEIRELRPYYQGDFYLLTEVNADNRQWCAWQFDRPDLNGGFVMAFRRSESLHPSAQLSLRGLVAEAEYEVLFASSFASERKQRIKGVNLANLTLSIESAPGSLLVRYSR